MELDKDIKPHGIVCFGDRCKMMATEGMRVGATRYYYCAPCHQAKLQQQAFALQIQQQEHLKNLQAA